MTSSGCLSGHHPTYSSKTFLARDNSDPYFYAYKNAKDEYYVYYEDKMVKVENPVPFRVIKF
jgi:hypothetical protein